MDDLREKLDEDKSLKEFSAMSPEERFYKCITSTEINLFEKFNGATTFSSRLVATPLKDSVLLQRNICVLEDGFRILVSNEDTFSNVFEYIRSLAKQTDRSDLMEIQMLISSLYEYVTDLTLLLKKQGSLEKAKLNFKNITKFCLLAISRYKISAKYQAIKSTCVHLEKSMPTITELDMTNDILNEIAKIMKACEKDKPRDFGHLRLLKGHIMKELGKPKEALSEYDKAQDFFRKLIFNWIDKYKKGKKSNDEEVLDVLFEINIYYKTSEQYIFRYWNENKQYLKAISVYQRFLKKVEVIKNFMLPMVPTDYTAMMMMIYFWGQEEELELGRCYFQANNYVMALRHFKHILFQNCTKIEQQISNYIYRDIPGRARVDTKLRFYGLCTKLDDLDSFDLLNIVITCRKKLELIQDKQEKTDVNLTPDMDIIWQKEMSLSEIEIIEDHDQYTDLLNAYLTLCMNTYWDQIHRVNLNDLYHRKLLRLQYNAKKEDSFLYCLNVIEILESQANRKHLPDFYEAVYHKYFGYRYYDEAMDVLMEWLDYKDRDFDWNFKMTRCLSEKSDLKEAEPYLIDCLKLVNPLVFNLIDMHLIFTALTRFIFYQKDNSWPVNPLNDYYFYTLRESLEQRHYKGTSMTTDAKILYDYLNGCFLQNIGSYETKTVMVDLVKLASLPSEKKEIIIDMVTFFINIKTCFFKGIWRDLFSSQYSIRSLQDEVLKALIENYECLNETQENVKLFANSCFLTRCLKNKYIS